MGPKRARGRLIALLAIACCCTSVLALDARERWPSVRHRSIEFDNSSDDQNVRGAAVLSSQRSRARPSRRLSSRHHNDFTESTITTTVSTTTSTSSPTTESALPTTTTLTTTEETKTSRTTLSDDALLLSSAGGGRESTAKKSTTSAGSSSSDDDDKKTLSQQVKEGKYGLIQDELFSERSRRPGILSYASNAEVPSDNANNLGGLTEDEIWLAENHVLVLKGGGFSDSDDDPRTGGSWPPIDDYQAPRRQVKIPPRPKVPPPFPVQLREGGPVQLILGNGSATEQGELLLPEPHNGTSSIDFEALPGGFRGFLPGEGPFFAPPQPLTPLQLPEQRRNKANGGELPPLYQSLPPGAVIVPPPSNQTDYDDEDQSMYYPPPYSFVYQGQDNSTSIPPGPLVPGIILPPPPDFFATLDAGPEGRVPPPPPSKASSKYSGGKRPGVSRPTSTPPRKPSSKPLYKTPPTTSPASSLKDPGYYVPKPFSRAKGYPKPERTTLPPPPPPPPPPPQPPRTLFVEVTTPSAPVQLSTQVTTLESPELEPIIGNQVISDSERTPWNQPVPQLPLLPSTSTTMANKTTERLEPRYPSQASYYFYEESGVNSEPRDQQPPSSSTAEPVIFFGSTAEAPPYRPNLESLVSPGKSYYGVHQLLEPPQHASKDFKLKLIDAVVVREPQIYRYVSDPEPQQPDPPRSQSPRMLHSEPFYHAAVPAATRESPPRLSYFATSTPPPPPRPKKTQQPQRRPETLSSISLDHFDDKPNSVPGAHKPKPIYQYSFEATNYPKRGRHIDTTLAAHQQYFTKQDEQLLDDVTKEYFSVFGKKLSAGVKLSSTTPVYGKSSAVTERPSSKLALAVGSYEPNGFGAPNIKVRYGDATPGPFGPPPSSSLVRDDVVLNFGQPQSNFVPLLSAAPAPLPRAPSPGPPLRSRYPPLPPSPHQNNRLSTQPHIQQEQVQRPQLPVNLADDLAVNYKQPRPALEPEAEFIGPAAPSRLQHSLSLGPEHLHQQQQFKPNSYFAYKLPGDGGHFYFLTPQAVQGRHREQQHHLGLYQAASSSALQSPRDSRLLRRRRARDGD
ncbi:hypothetical protein QAD02_012397 [Eretmocerus hayati]|uniref:Uncharacterized protein n=1 Tax=Eretmocerus hayati TaxID=131215 RepID=A0ACC2NZK1_9HYME|nr:hypothetical protein QAD02_012397 [Eretmocerus hayati]